MVDQAATKKKKKSRRPKRNQAVLPTWWMELTPHYTLDLDDELSRRLRDERMALYYSQLAEEEASKGMMFDIDGNPITVEEQAANTASGSGWKNNWAGRQPKDGNKNGNNNNGEGAEKPKMFGGRNFKPGSPGWDAKQWGIDEKDPDLEKYQSGERLPPQFIAAMNNFAKATGHYQANAANVEFANANLKSSGVYGGAAERMAHQPDWMKKKLRSSTAGQSIRHGVYDDSPNKHLKYQEARRNKDLEEQGGDENGGGGGQQPPEEEPATPEQEQEAAPTPRARSAPQQNKMDMDDGDEDPSVMVFSAPEPLSSTQPPSKEKQPEETTTETTPKNKFNFKDFYYNASTQQTTNVGQNNSTAAPAAPSPAPAAAPTSGGKKKWPTVQTTPGSAGGTTAAAEAGTSPTATETPTSNNNSAATTTTTAPPAAKKWTPPPPKKATPPPQAPAPAPASAAPPPKKWAPKPPEPAPAPAATPVTGPAANLVAPAPNSRWAPKAIVTSSENVGDSSPVKATSWNAPKPTATRTATPVKPSWNKTTEQPPPQPAAAMPGIPDPDNMYEEEEEEYEEEEVYDEEVVEEEHTEEEILEEEVIEEEEVADDTSLEDLQATLAAKMAELKKLQAM